MTTLQGEYEPSPAAWVRDQVAEYEASGGERANTLLDTGMPIVIVATRGAKTGKVRKNPVMRVEHEGAYALVASKGGAPENPAWVANLRKNPVVEVQDETVKGDYRARQATGEERAEWWRRAVEVWPDYESYQAKTDREIPVFLLEPTA
jgi:F420H(2)-dependent quinone reductase